MTRPLLGLAMIVKDEAACIARTLNSVVDFIDCWCVVDTGSTDGTQDIVRRALDGIPGRLADSAFNGFAESRNESLDGLRFPDLSPVFALVLSADEVLEGGVELRNFLLDVEAQQDGAYASWLWTGTSRTLALRIVRLDANWRFVGDPHEVLLGPGGERTAAATAPVAVKIVHEATDPERKVRRLKEYDLPRLDARAHDESADPETRAHAIFHLAVTHEAIANSYPKGSLRWISHRMLAFGYYQQRAVLGEDLFRSSYALFAAFNVASQLGFLYSDGEMMTRLTLLIDMNPRIPEVHFMRARLAAMSDVRKGLVFAEEAANVAAEIEADRQAGDQSTAMPMDSRIEWLSCLIGAGCASRLGKDVKARALAERGVKAGGPAEHFAEFLTKE